MLCSCFAPGDATRRARVHAADGGGASSTTGSKANGRAAIGGPEPKKMDRNNKKKRDTRGSDRTLYSPESEWIEGNTHEFACEPKAGKNKKIFDTVSKLERTPPALHFQKLRDEFLHDATLCKTIGRWEAGECDGLWIDEAQTQTALGALPASLPPHMRGKPIFQWFMEQLEGGSTLQSVLPTCIYHDKQVLVFAPAGFRGDAEADALSLEACHAAGADGNLPGGICLQTMADRLTKTPLTMNPTSLNRAGGAALMSHAHLLIVPRRRIYNAVTLKESDVALVRHMEKVGRAAVRALLRADGRTEHKTVETLEHVPTTLEELASATYLPGGLGMSMGCAARLATDISTTFHVYPQQSIGWLHMHAFCGSLLTRGFDSMDEKARQKTAGLSGSAAGFPKNIPSSIILAWLERTPSTVPLPPVDINQVLRALNAALIIQHVWRSFLEQKRKSGRKGLSRRALRESIAGEKKLRDMPRASVYRIKLPWAGPTSVRSSSLLAGEMSIAEESSAEDTTWKKHRRHRLFEGGWCHV